MSKQGTIIGDDVTIFTDRGCSEGGRISVYRGSIRFTPNPERRPNEYLEGAALNGRVFQFGNGPSFRVVAAYPRGSAAPGEFEYVAQTRTGYGQWRDVCGGRRALAVQGKFAFSGDKFLYTDADNAFFFACPDAVGVKCIDWGYKPWLWPGTRAQNPYGSCLYMGTANYCHLRDGSNTFPGTSIDYYDAGLTPQVGVRTPSSTWPIEAIWATSSNDPAAASVLLCLGKKRWDLLPLKGNCVSDPRLRPSGGGLNQCAPPAPTEPRYCFERTFAEWLAIARAMGSPGIIVNDSSFHDAGLYRFKDRTQPNRFYTTARFDARKEPSPGNSGRLEQSYVLHCFEGKIYEKTILHDAQATLAPLRSYRNAAGDYLTTAQGVPADFVPVAEELEGFIVRPSEAQPPQSVPLWRWRDGSRYITSTSRQHPTDAILEGYLSRSVDAGGVPFCDQPPLTPADVGPPPTITCPQPVQAECQGNRCATVSLPAASACSTGTVYNPPDTCYPLGTSQASFTTQDLIGREASCQTAVTVVDTTPPVIQGAPSAGTLSPVDGRYRTITLSDCHAQIVDQCQGALDMTTAQGEITCVTADEAGCDPDIRIVDARTVKLRAARDYHGDGRVYKIGFRVRDASGNSATGTCQVTVLKNGQAIDSGPKVSVCR